ncbi:MAG: AMP-binding protein, partial [Clostridia bacterium]|nr:AMP-binding protein [Clostridia bacterium]
MEFINKTIGEWMDKMASEHPDQPAVIYTHDFEYKRTYKEFNDEAHKIARAFLALGIKKDDHVAIWATNYPQWFLTLFACAKIGAVLVTVNTGYKIHEAEYLLKQSDTKMLVMCDSFKDTSYVDIMNRLCPEMLKEGADRANIQSKRLPILKKIVTIDEETHPGMYNWKELYDMDVPDEVYAEARKGLSPHDVVNMQYTSGTTGFPKGVMLTHYNILNNGKTIGDCMKFSTA